jgi:hypothetical protein
MSYVRRPFSPFKFVSTPSWQNRPAQPIDEPHFLPLDSCIFVTTRARKSVTAPPGTSMTAIFGNSPLTSRVPR